MLFKKRTFFGYCILNLFLFKNLLRSVAETGTATAVQIKESEKNKRRQYEGDNFIKIKYLI